MVLLATVATVIASQAVISGAFSVTHQAVQLGFLPRLTIRHTSRREVGQIYAPAINAGLFVAVLAIVLGFGSSTALASAYGVAVTGTFIINTILFLGGRAPAVAQAAVARSRSAPPSFLSDRADVLRGQPDEDRPRRLAAAGDRGGRLRRADDLAPRPRDRQREPRARGGAAAGLHRRARRARAPSLVRVPGTAVFLNATRRRRRWRCARTSSTTTCCTSA